VLDLRCHNALGNEGLPSVRFATRLASSGSRREVPSCRRRHGAGWPGLDRDGQGNHGGFLLVRGGGRDPVHRLVAAQHHPLLRDSLRPAASLKSGGPLHVRDSVRPPPNANDDRHRARCACLSGVSTARRGCNAAGGLYARYSRFSPNRKLRCHVLGGRNVKPCPNFANLPPLRAWGGRLSIWPTLFGLPAALARMGRSSDCPYIRAYISCFESRGREGRRPSTRAAWGQPAEPTPQRPHAAVGALVRLRRQPSCSRYRAPPGRARPTGRGRAVACLPSLRRAGTTSCRR